PLADASKLSPRLLVAVGAEVPGTAAKTGAGTRTGALLAATGSTNLGVNGPAAAMSMPWLVRPSAAATARAQAGQPQPEECPEPPQPPMCSPQGLPSCTSGIARSATLRVR